MLPSSGRSRPAAVDEALFLDAPEDLVELGFADLEGVVVALEVVRVSKSRVSDWPGICTGAKWPNGPSYSKPNRCL